MAIIETNNPMPGNVYRGDGAPSNDSTLLGTAPIGATYHDYTNGKLYICTVSTAANITWVVVGAQS